MTIRINDRKLFHVEISSRYFSARPLPTSRRIIETMDKTTLAGVCLVAMPSPSSRRGWCASRQRPLQGIKYLMRIRSVAALEPRWQIAVPFQPLQWKDIYRYTDD
jgi:hypothetical protein